MALLVIKTTNGKTWARKIKNSTRQSRDNYCDAMIGGTVKDKDGEFTEVIFVKYGTSYRMKVINPLI